MEDGVLSQARKWETNWESGYGSANAFLDSSRLQKVKSERQLQEYNTQNQAYLLSSHHAMQSHVVKQSS